MKYSLQTFNLAKIVISKLCPPNIGFTNISILHIRPRQVCSY